MSEAEKHIADARRRLQEVNSQGPPWGNVQKLGDAIESLIKERSPDRGKPGLLLVPL
jgi:hypothetical protein